MDAAEFDRKLSAIQSEAAAKVVALVHEAQEQAGLGTDTDQPIPRIWDYPNWERRADAFAELGGWIHDRVNGRNRTHRRSVTKRIRKALGYTYP